MNWIGFNNITDTQYLKCQQECYQFLHMREGGQYRVFAHRLSHNKRGQIDLAQEGNIL